jgi:hypothetical protein
MNEAERQARLNISPDVLREMERACPTSALRDIVRGSHAPPGPSSQGIIPTSQQLTGVRPGGGAAPTTGWQTERKFGDTGQHPTPGVNYADRIVDEFDRRDRAELAQRLGKR